MGKNRWKYEVIIISVPGLNLSVKQFSNKYDYLVNGGWVCMNIVFIKDQNVLKEIIAKKFARPGKIDENWNPNTDPKYV
jgi:hypothetical protein